jgi:hypothetical protein
MSTGSVSRPWYVRGDIVDEYRSTLTEDGETLPMLKTLKLLRAIIVNTGIIILGAFAIYRGGDPTFLGITALAVLGAYNGLELSDYLALVQAVQEVQASNTEDDDQP